MDSKVLFIVKKDACKTHTDTHTKKKNCSLVKNEPI